MDDLMRRTLKEEMKRSRRFSQKNMPLNDSNFDWKSNNSQPGSARLRSVTHSQDFKAGDFGGTPRSSTVDTSDVIMTTRHKVADAKLKMNTPVNLSWTQSKNCVKIPTMIERKHGEYFIGTYPTQATYDLPTCIGELMYTIPQFERTSGRYRRLHGNLLKSMNGMQRAEFSRDGAAKEIRPMNINYEKMLSGYERLGHMKKLAVPFDMGKAKARDSSMLMQTDAYKNILYENHRLEYEEMFGMSPPTRKKADKNSMTNCKPSPLCF